MVLRETVKWELFIILEVHNDLDIISIDKNFFLKKINYVRNWDHLEVLTWLPDLVTQERRKDLGGVLVEAEHFTCTFVTFTEARPKLFRDG